ncbi:hypothetical protein EYF80_032585 [Liparis tanakae]|uniref:Uncharacterized protein n=1 Tax=Liparis tanakae TaxID=230148 RepID=A0A4Z2GVN5_9TELE|nr:hypothetical protein EYF80_032585 [Liparis tanakae]
MTESCLNINTVVFLLALLLLSQHRAQSRPQLPQVEQSHVGLSSDGVSALVESGTFRFLQRNADGVYAPGSYASMKPNGPFCEPRPRTRRSLDTWTRSAASRPSPGGPHLAALLVGTPRDCMASLHRNSLTEERITARPSPDLRPNHQSHIKDRRMKDSLASCCHLVSPVLHLLTFRFDDYPCTIHGKHFHLYLMTPISVGEGYRSRRQSATAGVLQEIIRPGHGRIYV